MAYRQIFETKDPSANFYAVFNFAEFLSAGVTLSSAVVTATVYSGTDATPSSIISGSASVSSPLATQTITGGTEGVTYYLRCVGTLSDSKVAVRTGYLTVAKLTV